MKEYLRILRNVLENGTPKLPVRHDTKGNPISVENGTIGTFCEVFRHNMSEGFPLITTKKMAFKTICVELEGFIKGITDKRWYKDRGCNIWNEWSDPEEAKIIFNSSRNIDPITGEKILTYNQILEKENSLGPVYGYGWRNFGKQYKHHLECQIGEGTNGENVYYTYNLNGLLNGYDQFKSICDILRSNPYDRRMVCSAWNPNHMHMMALPPCHVLWNVVVYKNKLNLTWFQRSCDSLLGIPFNIASYALLLLILSKHAGLDPGELVGILSDCHLYNNHIEQAKIQLTREPFPLPTLIVKDNKDGGFDPLKWEHDDVQLINYKSHPKITAEITV